MTRYLLSLLLFISTTPAMAQDHTAVVIQVKADLVRRNVDIAGACGAFAITKRVAWLLRSEGAGLLDKPGGNQCDGFATDIIAYPSGQIFDILSDGGGENGPSWQDKGNEGPQRYRPAFDPGDVPNPGTPLPIPGTPAPPPPIFIPLPSTDLSPVLNAQAVNYELLKDVRAAIAELRIVAVEALQEIKAHRAEVRSKFDAVMGKIGKYVLPAVAALFAGMQVK